MSKEQNIKIITTQDGSHSLLYEELEETYHSIHGAIQESNHVYIEAGLNYWLSKNPTSTSLNILEFGFGTGLNALLTSLKTNSRIKATYDTLEKYPIAKKVSKSLNYGKLMHNPELFSAIHSAKWGEAEMITPDFLLAKTEIDFQEYKGDKKYDIIYFDAFAPSKQPELWTKEIFESCYGMMHQGAVLVTYSAKGQLKRDLKSLGFTVESLPGPPGKFEITRAMKSGLNS